MESNGVSRALQAAWALAAVLAGSPVGIASVTAVDDDCGPIDMTAPGGALEHVPPLDQGNTGICYAYVAAQQIDAYRFSHGDRQYHRRSSPTILALEGALFDIDAKSADFERRLKGFFNYGVSEFPARAAKAYGVCERASLQENRALSEWIRRNSLRTRGARKDGKDPEEPLLSALMGVYDSYAPWRALALEASTNAPREDARLDGIDPCPDFMSFTQATGFPADLVQSFLNVDSPVLFGHGWAQRACGSRIIPPPFKEVAQHYYFVEASARKRGIHDDIRVLLERGMASQPISIGACSAVLKKDADRNWFGDKECEAHDMLLAGRRRFHGRCQYLIRNSWGTSCNLYLRNEKVQCDGRGNVWIDAERLEANAWYLHQLQ